MQIVLVKFQDPTTQHHWSNKQEVDESVCRVCVACGFLFEENDKFVKVALLCSEDKETWSDWITIPMGCVLSIDKIKEVDWDA